MQVQINLTSAEAALFRRLAFLTEKLFDKDVGCPTLEEIMMNSGTLKTVASVDDVRLVMEPGQEPWLIVVFTYDNHHNDTFYVRCSPSGYAGTHIKIGN